MENYNPYEKSQIPKLTRLNCENWFRRMIIKLKGKDILFVTELALHQFAWTSKKDEGFATENPTSTADQADWEELETLKKDFSAPKLKLRLLT